MDITELRYVREVAKQKSFSKAAEKLYVSQSALSQKIAKLESTLGVRIFQRTTKSVSLTEAGEILVQYADKILSLCGELESQMNAFSNSAYSNVSIGLFQQAEYSPFPGYITNFILKSPNIHVDVSLTLESHLISGLKDGMLDYVIMRCYERDIPGGLLFEPLYADDVKVILCKDDPLSSREFLYLDDLLEYTLIAEKGWISLPGTADRKRSRISESIIYSDNSLILSSLLLSTERYFYTTSKSAEIICQKFPYVRSVKLIDADPVTSYIFYSKSGKWGNTHPLCKYLKERCREINSDK